MHIPTDSDTDLAKLALPNRKTSAWSHVIILIARKEHFRIRVNLIAHSIENDSLIAQRSVTTNTQNTCNHIHVALTRGSR